MRELVNLQNMFISEYYGQLQVWRAFIDEQMKTYESFRKQRENFLK